jgi:2-polyprenyl-3-methyl-5-hydroxy-6-metoxy-1,4-benzoquinol methylase
MMPEIRHDTQRGSCPLCNGQELSTLYSAGGALSKFSIVQCPECELARTFPSPTEYVINIDPSKYYGQSVNKFIPILQKIRDIVMNNRAKYFLSLLKGGEKALNILDIGCAEGRLLKAFHEKGCKCCGIEHKDYPESRFLESDRIVYIQRDLESVQLPDRSYDLIFIWHVLEHMDNPVAVIAKSCSLLAENGILILAVPNFSSMEAKIFKQSWFHLDIPWHKYHFTKKSLEYLVEKNNLRIVKSSTFCLEQGVYGVIQSILNAMGWPRNELYEAMKGNISSRRVIPLIVQALISLCILMPSIAMTVTFSIMKKGSVLKLVLRKGSAYPAYSTDRGTCR